jgi:hypothetical protein
MKNFAAAVAAFALTAALSTAFAQAECLKYDSKTTLTGKVVERVGHGASGRGDTIAVPYHVLVLAEPICFESDEDYPSEQNIKVLQLWIGDDKYCKVHPGKDCGSRFLADFSKKYVGKTVGVFGQLFHQIIAWHRTTVLIDVETINLLLH